MTDIVGKWTQIEGQPYEGLWFDFKSDGTFEAQYEPMGIVSSGTYQVEDDRIDMHQIAHTLGMVGDFQGRYAIKGDHLNMAVAAGPGMARPVDLSDARIYQKE
ncbi:MAG: hypothetical protein ACK2TV_04570 [Anaerolineales bacterium]